MSGNAAARVRGGPLPAAAAPFTTSSIFGFSLFNSAFGGASSF